MNFFMHVKTFEKIVFFSLMKFLVLYAICIKMILFESISLAGVCSTGLFVMFLCVGMALALSFPANMYNLAVGCICC